MNIESLKKDLHFSTQLRGHSLEFTTTWGLFSPEKLIRVLTYYSSIVILSPMIIF